jgi:hypothetical protein
MPDLNGTVSVIYCFKSYVKSRASENDRTTLFISGDKLQGMYVNM